MQLLRILVQMTAEEIKSFAASRLRFLRRKACIGVPADGVLEIRIDALNPDDLERFALTVAPCIPRGISVFLPTRTGAFAGYRVANGKVEVRRT